MSGIAPAHEVVVVRQDDAEVLGGPPVTGRLYADSSATGRAWSCPCGNTDIAGSKVYGPRQKACA